VARDYEVSRYWAPQLVSRYQREGSGFSASFSASASQSACGDTEDAIRLRKELSKQGLDVAETIPAPGPLRAGAIGPAGAGGYRRSGGSLPARFRQPATTKLARSSWRMFCADKPNERWQADITHWQLADGIEISILNIVDDHSRPCLRSDARRNTTGLDVVASFRKAFALPPFSAVCYQRLSRTSRASKDQLPTKSLP
jgi:hypothetical protein